MNILKILNLLQLSKLLIESKYLDVRGLGSEWIRIFLSRRFSLYLLSFFE